MTLADHTEPVMVWGDGSTVTLTIVCHCGQSFGLGDLEAAQAHVATHEPVDEPS